MAHVTAAAHSTDDDSVVDYMPAFLPSIANSVCGFALSREIDWFGLLQLELSTLNLPNGSTLATSQPFYQAYDS